MNHVFHILSGSLKAFQPYAEMVCIKNTGTPRFVFYGREGMHGSFIAFVGLYNNSLKCEILIIRELNFNTGIYRSITTGRSVL